MINLKEACRYANYLDDVLYKVGALFDRSENAYKITELHKRSESNPAVADEEVVVTNERIFTKQLSDIAFLYERLLNEKLQLALAINIAKSTHTIAWSENNQMLDLDSAIEYNKKLRNFSQSKLKYLSNKKDSMDKLVGKGFMINAEGNQVAYSYTVEKNYKVDFDKKVISDKSKKLLEKTDKISTLIDEFMLKQIVDFTPAYSLHDSVEDIIEKFETE